MVADATAVVFVDFDFDAVADFFVADGFLLCSAGCSLSVPDLALLAAERLLASAFFLSRDNSSAF